MIATKYDKRVTWDDATPEQDYFDALRRVSKNQIIWGANYYTQYLPPTNSWIIWDKKYNTDELTFSMGEMAWSSFSIPLKIYAETNNKPFSKKIHPTEKPVTLYKWLLNRYAKDGDIILDTHVGSASSLVACRETGHKYVGFEIDREYYEKALERLTAAENQQNIFDYMQDGFTFNPYQE